MIANVHNRTKLGQNSHKLVVHRMTQRFPIGHATPYAYIIMLISAFPFITCA